MFRFRSACIGADVGPIAAAISDVAGLARYDGVVTESAMSSHVPAALGQQGPVPWWPMRRATTANHARVRVATRGGAW
jgi:hypothetical protein